MSRGVDRGISPVVGGVLLLAITVLLVASVGVMLFAATGELSNPMPSVVQSQSVEVGSGPSAAHRLQFRHEGGQSVDVDQLRVRVAVAGQATTRTPAREGALADGQWSVGEAFDVALNETRVCAPSASTVNVSIIYEGSGSQQFEMSERRIPIERTDFVIHPSEGAVVPTRNYTAKVRFIGSSWGTETTYAPVRVLVRSGGSVVHRWRSNDTQHDGFPPYHLSTQTAGTSLSVTAKGQVQNWFWTDWRVVDAAHNAEYMRVLRDGDPVPGVEGSSGQKAVAAYVAPYVKNGRMSLKENQAVFLFDFNTDRPPAEVDYQDAVVLVSFFSKAPTTQPGVYRNRTQTHVVACGNEEGETRR